MLTAASLAFGVVFFAELGDKSQLLILSLAGRFRRLPVFIGVSTAAVFMQALSVVAGSLIADYVPRRPVEIVAGVLFLGFAGWSLLPDKDEDVAVEPTRHSAILTSGFAFVAAEFGDKTMLATAALAARGDRLGTWLGSSAAMIVSATMAVAAGAVLARRVDPIKLRYAAAAVFAIVGVALLAGLA
jgi:putative Ca2+/H+ antiporter (TMEM165/GDT1 family)